jgi:hypothetical protein
MQQVGALLKQQKAAEAEALIDESLALLADPAATSAATPSRDASARIATVPKLGLIPASPDGDVSLIPSAFFDARDAGVDVLYWYFNWADVVREGGPAQWVMGPLTKGGRAAVNFAIIHTTVLGKYAPPWKSFDEPGFAAAFAAFAADFVAQYHPDFFFVGNEANTYLEGHHDQVAAYAEVVRATAAAIHARQPSTRVGVVISYPETLKHDQHAMVATLAQSADLIGYTVYGDREGFEFVDPQEGVTRLRALRTFVPGKPYAVVETGWNSSPDLGSSEEKQAAFVNAFFDFVRDGDALFVNWFLYRDGKDCSKVARGFLASGAMPGSDRMRRFEEFLCRFGLKDADGRPKQGWNAWLARARAAQGPQ